VAVVDEVLVVFRQTAKARSKKERGIEGRGGLDVGLYLVPEEGDIEEAEGRR